MTLLVLGACDNRTNTTRCTTTCSTVQMCCATSMGNRCIDFFSDPANCGGCGNVCASGQLCVNRMCTSTMGLPDSGMPVDARSVPIDSPTAGSCSPSCGADFQCCGSTCVNRDGAGGTTDPSFSNCGSCGRACDSDVANRCGRFGTMTACMCGTGPACDSRLGETCVLGMSGDYECLRSDIPENCGSPPVACNPGEACEGGMCVCGSTGRPCPTGESCVSTGGSSSCRDLSTDPLNCGMVGNACGMGEVCAGGMCGCPGAGGAVTMCMRAGGGGLPIGGGPPSCMAEGGFTMECGGGGGLPIGGGCGEVCCPGRGCIAADAANCGGCGVACSGGQICGTSLIGGGDGGLPFP